MWQNNQRHVSSILRLRNNGARGCCCVVVERTVRRVRKRNCSPDRPTHPGSVGPLVDSQRGSIWSSLIRLIRGSWSSWSWATGHGPFAGYPKGPALVRGNLCQWWVWRCGYPPPRDSAMAGRSSGAGGRLPIRSGVGGFTTKLSHLGGSQISQANRFSPTNRGVAIGTREVTYLGNSRTADSFFGLRFVRRGHRKAEFRFSARAYTRHRA